MHMLVETLIDLPGITAGTRLKALQTEIDRAGWVKGEHYKPLGIYPRPMVSDKLPRIGDQIADRAMPPANVNTR